MGLKAVAVLLVAALVACSEGYTLRNGTVKATFRNPVADFPWPDPYVHKHNDGFYYMPRSENNGVAVYKSRRLSNFRDAERALVVTAPGGLMNLWAPELHFINGNFYLYFALDNGDNANHRMYVSRALDPNNPMGRYTEPKRMAVPGEDFWAIDATILQYGNGQNYVIWSGWPTVNAGFPQNLYIARLCDPETICTPRVLLAEPRYDWEVNGAPLLEGPQILHNAGRVFVIFSASGSWTADYNLGFMGIDNLADPMNPGNWWRHDRPVFCRNDEQQVYGVGHASFTRSPDNSEPWIIYLEMERPDAGWEGRTARVERFGWNPDNSPAFPRPSRLGTQLEAPRALTTKNGTGQTGGPSANEELSWDDATWILTSAFIIFTMQTGFGLLESGCVSLKNEVNIMMKNVIDIVFGGITYWLFGFGLTNGKLYSNPFIAFGYFAVDADIDEMGPIFSTFLFQLSFATTATTIVSGAMAERCNFRAYCIFSLLNTIIYCVPAGWIWGQHGFLRILGAIDIGGSGAVHLIGGSSAFVAAWMLGPRLGRYDHGHDPLPMGSPTNALLGLFMLWWGWLAFSSGSVFGVSGHKWKFSARAAVATINASFGGGIIGLIWSYIRKKGKFDILDLISSVLGSLVSVTGGCAIYRPWEAIVIGVIGGALACVGIPFFDWLHIDDPVGATSVHGLSAFWGVLAIGFFADGETLLSLTNGKAGLFKGGDAYLLGVQTLAAVSFTLWAGIVTFILLWIINKFIPIRMESHEELLGADLVEHGIRRPGVGVSRALSALGSHPNFDIEAGQVIGTNPGHEMALEKYLKEKGAARNGHNINQDSLNHIARSGSIAWAT